MASFDKLGYLNDDFRIFHNIDAQRKVFDYHYHDFNKIMIFLRGDMNYFIEAQKLCVKTL